jgi:phage terminase large subunit-like protein
MARSLKQILAAMPPARQRAWLMEQTPKSLEEIARNEWWWTGRPEQMPPPGEWLIYLILSGRGFGKTRCGAEWIIKRTLKHPVDSSGAPTERLVVGHTIADARNMLINGPSGMLRVLDRQKIRYRYYKSPKPRILFLDSQCVIHAEGAETADVGRGHNLSDVWMDEFAKWKFPKQSWLEGIMPALRISIPGDHPRALVTTTPKPLQILRDWSRRDDGSVIVVAGSTFDNSDNLSERVLDELRNEYEGTTLGQQELWGVILDDAAGNLFRAQDFNAARVEKAPKLVDVVVGVDPGLTGEGDETGIIVVGRDEDDDWYILADVSIKGVGREACLHVWRTYMDFSASHVVVETNLGRKWMTETFEGAYHDLVEQVNDSDLLPARTPPIESVDAKAGKLLRAQPVGLRCEQHRLHPVGHFNLLESQAVDWDPNTSKDSPDRLDALVHACLYHKRQEKRVVVISEPTKATPLVSRNETDHLLWGSGGGEYDWLSGQTPW